MLVLSHHACLLAASAAGLRTCENLRLLAALCVESPKTPARNLVESPTATFPRLTRLLGLSPRALTVFMSESPESDVESFRAADSLLTVDSRTRTAEVRLWRRLQADSLQRRSPNHAARGSISSDRRGYVAWLREADSFWDQHAGTGSYCDDHKAASRK